MIKIVLAFCQESTLLYSVMVIPCLGDFYVLGEYDCV